MFTFRAGHAVTADVHLPARVHHATVQRVVTLDAPYADTTPARGGAVAPVRPITICTTYAHRRYGNSR